jgi:lipid II:glycine glycyltransferase (peptidoglycan interpeptide bridge formation enzyme)
MNNIKSKWIDLDNYIIKLKNLESDNLSIYHQKNWLLAIKNGFNCELSFILTENNDEVLALTPFMTKMKGFVSISGSPLRGMYTEFSGQLTKKNIDKETFNKIIFSQHALIAVKNSYLEFGFNHNREEFSSINDEFLRLGYSYESRPSLLIDLSVGSDEVWSGFKGRARNMIRKAEKSGIISETIEPDLIWIEEYYNLLIETFKKQALSTPHPLSFFKELLDLSKAGLIKCVHVKQDKKIIAAAIFILDRDRIMYFSGVADRKGMKLAATSLIQWHIIKDAINMGIKSYDMGGLGIESIDKFKRSFGGVDIFHHRWIYRGKLFYFIEPILIWLSRKGLIRLGE